MANALKEPISSLLEKVKRGLLDYVMSDEFDPKNKEQIKRFYLFYLYFDHTISKLQGNDRLPDIKDSPDTQNKTKLDEYFIETSEAFLKSLKQLRPRDLTKTLRVEVFDKYVEHKKQIIKCIENILNEDIKKIQTQENCDKEKQIILQMINQLKLNEPKINKLMKIIIDQDLDDNDPDKAIIEMKRNTFLKFNDKFKKTSVQNILAINAENSSFSSLLSSTLVSGCDEMRKYIDSKNVFNIVRNIGNLNEDINGLVRVYVRFRGDERQGLLNRADNKYKQTKLLSFNDCNKNTYGPFYGIYDTTNAELFTGKMGEQERDYNSLNVNISDNILDDDSSYGLCKATKQVEYGYSTVLFSSGSSGSSKSITLIGGSIKVSGNETREVPGIIFYALANLKNVKTIKIKHIFEETVDVCIVNRSASGVKFDFNGKIVNLLNLPAKRDLEYIKKKVQIVANFGNRNIDLNNVKNENDVLNDVLFNIINLVHTKSQIKYSDLKFENYNLFSNLLDENSELHLIEGDVLNINKLKRVLEITTSHRISNQRIKTTPNNPESSRSHLFIVFEIGFIDGITGYITAVDMGGRENPFEIYDTYLEGNNSAKMPLSFENFIGTKDILPPESIYYRYIKTDVKNTNFKNYLLNIENLNNQTVNSILPQMINTSKEKISNEKEFFQKIDKSYKTYIINYVNYLKNIIKEGFYINETINHLKHYFLSKTDSTDSKEIIRQYDTNDYQKIFGLPESKNYDVKRHFIHKQVIYDSFSNTNSKYCFTIPILEYLDSLGGGDKPTKFISLMCIRDNLQKCKETTETLEFANEIKST